MIDKLIRFVGSEMSHVQTPYYDHVITLRTGKGMCGKTAIVLSMLFRTFDIPSRIMSVGQAHIICEFLYRGRWCLGDCNLFKGPLLNVRGQYLTRGDVYNDDYYLSDLYALKKHSAFSMDMFINAVKSPIRYPLYYDIKRRKMFSYLMFVLHVFWSSISNFHQVLTYAKKRIRALSKPDPQS